MEKPQRRVISVFTLIMINVAAICNIANLSFTAQQGFSSLFYYAIASIMFFIPVGLISAELATGWPQRGGVYIWVREALGERAGFIAIWLMWVENVIWYPTSLSFVAATLAYLFDPSLAENKLYIMTIVLIVFWSLTMVNLRGMKVSAWISTLCVIIGTILPGILIILLGISWFAKGNPSQISYSWNNLFPSFTSFSHYSILAAVLLSMGGLEMSAVHASDVQKPQKNYPKAILFSTIIIFFLFSLGALSIASIVPQEKIQLASGTVEALKSFLEAYKLSWFLPIIACFIVIGTLGLISTWIAGPSKGLLATALDGQLPPLLQKTNKKKMPFVILLLQAGIVTTFSFFFLLMPTVSATYRLLFSLAAQLYLIMYIMMFAAGIILRYKRPEIPRAFRIPLGNVGIWMSGILGIISAFSAIILGFLPSQDFQVDRIWIFDLFLFFAIIFFCTIPILIHRFKKPHWRIYKND